jgi:hypothetical protein
MPGFIRRKAFFNLVKKNLRNLKDNVKGRLELLKLKLF